MPTKPSGRFEFMSEVYAPTKAFFDKTWKPAGHRERRKLNSGARSPAVLHSLDNLPH